MKCPYVLVNAVSIDPKSIRCRRVAVYPTAGWVIWARDKREKNLPREVRQRDAPIGSYILHDPQ